MALAEARQGALDARLSGLHVEGAGWLGAARGRALSRLEALGLPVRRDEYWRYTDPALFTAPEPPKQSDIASEEIFADLDRLRIVFTDGRFDAGASDDLTGTGVEIDLASRAARTDIHWARDLYGVLEAEGQVPVSRPFAAMASAFASDGVLIRVTGQVARPVALIYRRGTADAVLHHVLRLEPGASLTLLESGEAGARSTIGMEVEVCAGARLDHIRAQSAPGRVAATHLFARLGDGARFKSFTLTMDGTLSRNEIVIDIAGSDASAHVAGAAVGDGAFHHDDTVFVTHRGQRCESRQVFKSVLKNGAVGVFQGKILVKSQAQKTDGYQISQALMLDGDSQFLAKPELEIYADDVKCSHGSTSGAIDEVALFYLRARGVPLRNAQALLVLAFLAEALAEIADATLAEEIHAALDLWLARHDA